MEITYTSAIKLISLVHSLTRESPLKKVSRNELEAAIREINNLKYENRPHECLNRTLCHLESAYSQFEPSTWNFLDDENRVLWDQRTYKNTVCLAIAVIHFYLGNKKRAKTWLSDELSEYGWIFMPDEALNLLEFCSTKDFFNAVYGDNGETYEQIEWAIKIHNDQAYDDSGWNPLDASQNPYPY